MGLLDFLNRTKIKQFSDGKLEYEVNKVGSIEVPDRLTDNNAFVLANTVAEIFFPIDFLADRASKLRFYIADKAGNEVINTELNRFITDINPLFSFSDLFYQAVFSYLSDGNMITYLGTPSLYNKITVNSIDRIDVLQPNLLSIYEYTNISQLTARSNNDYINKAQYAYVNGFYDNLDVEKLHINTYDNQKKDLSLVLCKSPLFKSYRSINNLLATYSARYNVYNNNGAAGYISKKQSGKTQEDIINDAGTRDEILKDINNRNGLTGKRNLWGISGTPIEFVNTLVTIKDLLPFEETLEDSIKIASTYQIPSGLVPRKDQSTYNNQDADEKKVWENTLMSIVDSVCSYFTKAYQFKGYSIKADYSTVSALKVNEIGIEDLITKKIQNLQALKNLNPELNLNNQINKIVQGYE